jgi:ABC-type transport system involved in multi-copper enzyme maturation permease subunit
MAARIDNKDTTNDKHIILATLRDTMEQMAGAIPSPLPFKESIMIVWPQVSGLLASTAGCFALAYYLFMRREIRS